MHQRLRTTDLLPIGELARRTGLSVSAIRFYEERGWSNRSAPAAISAGSCAATSAG